MAVEPDAWNDRDEPLVAFTTAAALLHRGDYDAIARLVANQELEQHVAVRRAPRRGRRPDRYVRLADVERFRAAELERLGAVEAAVAQERDALEAKVLELEAALRSRGAGAPPPIGDEIVDLERRNLELTERVARLHGALMHTHRSARNLSRQVAEGASAYAELLESNDELIGHETLWTDTGTSA